ncbi:hypothetical protein IAU60_005134 [Kwoniella sp. DSM 27419]
MAGGPSSSTAAARNKLVIRRLPPTLPEDIFWNAVAPWVNENTCSWKRYVKGKAGDGNHDSHPVHSRAYVLMSSPEALVELHRGFDGHLFKSKTGAEYQAVVEYAPVQRTPFMTKVKVDARQATIDEDPDYQSFLESLNAPAVKPVLETTVAPPQPTSTPLLDHLRAQGKGKGKSKNKSSGQGSAGTTESARRAAALASVNAAASKRAPQNGGGPIMVAGKGREVVLADPSAIGTENGASAGAAGEGKKKGRGRKKGNKAETEAQGAAGAGGTQAGAQAGKQAAANSGPGSGQKQGGKGQGQGQSGGGRGKGGGQKEPKKSDDPSGTRPDRAGQAAKAPGDSAVSSPKAAPTGEAGTPTAGGSGAGAGRGRGNRGGRGGGRGGGAGGGGDGKDRSGRGQVVEILSRTGSAPAAKHARGAQTQPAGGAPPPRSAARIDVP